MNFIQQKIDRKKKISKPKKNEPDSVLTIHNNKLKYFEELQSKILPRKQLELQELQSKNSYKYDIKIMDLKKEIKNIQEKKEENDYYLSTIRIYHDYILNIEDSSITHDHILKRKELINKYYNAVGIFKPVDTYVHMYDCKNCNNANTMVEQVDCFSCSECGFTSRMQTYPTELSFQEKKEKDPTSNNIGYKRVNYLIECLNQMQAKENINISEEVLDKILIQIGNEKIKDLSNLSYIDIRRYLKNTGQTKYYEHAPYILYIITKIKPPQIPPQIEEKLIWMFQEIQEPYERFKPETRSSCFNYPYCINKLMELLELEQFRPYFKLLKDRNKRHIQDTTWKKVMEYLKENKNPKSVYDIDWRFIRTV
jgi:Zn ribbon nucleic-acid-binding protein